MIEINGIIMIKKIVVGFCGAKGSRLFLFGGQGTQEVGMLDKIP